MKKQFLSIALLATAVFSEEQVVSKPACNEDLKAILTKTFLNEKAEPFLNMIAMEAIHQSGKEANPEDLIAKFKESFTSEEVLAKLAEPYKGIFSDDEIHQLKAIYDSAVFEKYTQQGNQVFQSNFMTIQDTFKDLALKHGTEKKAKEVSSSVIEVTEENYSDVVEKSKKPLVIDIYSSNCGPCRNLEPIFNELSTEYKDLQFVRINCETQSELTDKFDVTKVPTILFINGGQEVSKRTTGFTTKSELSQKITEFKESALQ